MEAYWFAMKDGEMTVAKPNRDITSMPLRQYDWNAPIPIEMFAHYPSEAWAPPRKRPPTSWLAAAAFSVSPDVKATIEELESGVHQFIPLTVKSGTRAEHVDYPYFSLRICQRIDDVLVEKSDGEWRAYEFEGAPTIRRWSKKQAPLVLPASSIKGKHLWANREAGIDLMSGDLYHRLIERGLTKGLRFQQQIVE